MVEKLIFGTVVNLIYQKFTYTFMFLYKKYLRFKININSSVSPVNHSIFRLI